MINNDEKEINPGNKKANNDELLVKGKEILNTLVVENMHKRDKSFITTKELEIMKEYEANLMELINNCPPGVMAKILDEIGTDVKQDKIK
jgi:hypothetical protein